MREVAISTFDRKESLKRVLVHDYDGLFHGWGVDYEEFESGPGPYTAAIVEKGDGTVEMVPVFRLRFKTPTIFDEPSR